MSDDNGPALVLIIGLACALLAVGLLTFVAVGQPTQINLATQAKGAYVIPNGPFASMPRNCTVGQQYMATDQPLGQMLYLCSPLPPPVAPDYIQQLNLGGSGALVVTGGSLDVNPAIVPLNFQ